MPNFIRPFVCLLVVFCNVTAAEAIHNDRFLVVCDQGRYALSVQGQDKPFAYIPIRVTGAQVATSIVNDADFGRGLAIENTAADGSADSIQIFPGLPFVLYNAVITNPEKTPVVVNKVPLFDADLQPGQPLDALVGLGTGGLNPLARSPASFAWLTIADPRSRTGIVAGWLTHERGTGVVTTAIKDGRLGMEARLEYGCLRLEPGKAIRTETFALGWFADARLGMESWADAVAKRLAITLPPMPIVYCTWYDNVHGGSSDEKHLAELAAFAAKELKPYGLSCVQIDDGWQLGDSKGNGSAKNFSQYNPHGAYGSGMKATADNLATHGFTAGLWILPFGGSWNDPFFAEHQDWFAKRKDDGKPYDTPWGGTALDMTHPGARAFVAGEIRQAVHDWGYHYLKLDGLSTGLAVKPMYVEDSWKEDGFGDAVFHDPTKTNVDAFRDGLRLVREAAGPGAFILGCCAPQNMRSYAGVFGLVNAMRMGPDNDGSWSGWRGSCDFGSRNYHLNGRIWWSDPDPMYVRASIPLDSARCIASWNSISGQMISLSDWLPGLPADRIDIIRRTIPSHGVTARPIDLLTTWPPRQWQVTDQRRDHQRRDVVGLFNWSYKAEDSTVALADLGLPPAEECIAFDFWNRIFLRPFTGALTVNVPGAACRVLAVRPLLAHPFLISTSRHVAQGIVEVTKEAWDDQGNALFGSSAVVAGDAYELRVVAIAPAAGWTLIGSALSPADVAAGGTIAATGTNGLIRAVITSPVSRDVTWTLRFARGGAQASPPAKTAGAAWAMTEDGEDVRLSWKIADGAACEVAYGHGDPVLCDTGTCTITGLEPGKTYQVRLTPVAWSGVRGDATELVVKTPPARACPPVPPAPTVRLTTLKAIEARTGYGKVTPNASMDGHPLSVGGAVYANGIGVHAESLLVYEVKPEYRRFVAVAGIDDEVTGSPASVQFKVIAEVGDDKVQIASSPRLRAKQPLTKWHFDVAIPERCTRLRLVVEDAGDGISNDHADWVDAGFVTAAP